MDLATIGSLVIGGASAFNLDECTDVSADSGTEVMSAAGAGQPAPSFAASTKADPVIEFTTLELIRALTNIDPLLGLHVDSAGSAFTSLNAYWTKYLVGSTRRGSLAHYKWGSIGKALILPKQLSVELNANGSLSGSVMMYAADGTTQPYTLADSVSLPHTPAVDQVYTLGGGWIGGTAVNTLVGLTYDFGLSPIIEREGGAGGAFFPTFVGIESQGPELTLKTKSPINLSTFSINAKGLVQSATASDFYLVKRKNMEATEAAASTVHLRIRINASQGIWTGGATSGSQGKASELEIKCRPIVGVAALATFGLGVAHA